MSDPIIEVYQLIKTYHKQLVLKGISFNVYSGETFTLIGPNGAGKTTTLSILEGLRSADSGKVSIFGYDITTKTNRTMIQSRIGVQLQSTSLIPDMQTIEQVQLFARLYGRKLSRKQALSLLEQVGIEDKINALPKHMSGGQQQRLVLAISLVNEPDLLFLDEPTSGLDPQARQQLWSVIENLRYQGTTVVLTTHYLEEAERMSNRIGILDQGQIRAIGTASQLVNAIGGLALISVDDILPLESLSQMEGVKEIVQQPNQLHIYTQDATTTNLALLQLAQRIGVSFNHLQIRYPSLEDVYLRLIGTTQGV